MQAFLIKLLFLYTDTNPAKQGASLTERKRKEKGKQNGGDSPRGEEDDDDWNDNWGDSNGKTNGEEDDGDWSVDVSEAAVRRRQQALSDGVKGLTVSDDLEKPEKDRMDIFYKFLQAKIKSENKLDHKELLSEAERLDVRNKATIVLVELLLDSNIIQQVRN
jgi:translation initiation factor 5